MKKFSDLTKVMRNVKRPTYCLEVVSAAVDYHQAGQEWLNVRDMVSQLEVDLAVTAAPSMRQAIKELTDAGVIEKRFLDLDGQLVERPTKSPVIRLHPDYLDMFRGGYEKAVA
ncbi:hypothetical protein [Enterovibrio paralichthyis]|uniref:hypothetical protein n=1 Tax=Enterovibrio paralichthyis TaxID=2853805 RepID=UPI001C4407FB|nr:hypothetical protein [Enterovibrio paralichthyis]MBV7300220.1 hypothetical protein [Enterovibrio paralichthyis]